MSTPTPPPSAAQPDPEKRTFWAFTRKTLWPWTRNMIVVLFLFGVLLAIFGDRDDLLGSAPNDGPSNTSTSESVNDDDESNVSDEPEPAPEIDIDGAYRSSCDYLIGEWDSWYRIVADATVHNTGNVGNVDKVVATWYLAGGDTIVLDKKVRSEPGERKRVGFDQEINEEQLDRIQSLHMSDMKVCDVKVTTIDTFGTPQG